ncbi:hypothetical protein AHAS_Ahas08G0127500 [Arachis hypogaea]
MVKAIRVHQIGAPQVLKWEDVEIGEPKEGEVRVKHKAIGVNFIDVYFRTGVYEAPSFPYTPGVEAVGVVIAVGAGVTSAKVGDLVGYAGRPLGSYTEERILPAEKVVPIPPSIDPAIGASVMSKGMTALFLIRHCFKTNINTILVHAAAGGIGSLLCQWANALEEDYVARVNEITSGNGVEVVYDSVGKDTFQSERLKIIWSRIII